MDHPRKTVCINIVPKNLVSCMTVRIVLSSYARTLPEPTCLRFLDLRPEVYKHSFPCSFLEHSAIPTTAFVVVDVPSQLTVFHAGLYSRITTTSYRQPSPLLRTCRVRTSPSLALTGRPRMSRTSSSSQASRPESLPLVLAS